MSTFSEMKVATKLSLGFGLLVALMVVSGVLAYFALNSIDGRLKEVINDKVPKVEWLADINYNVLDIARGLRSAYMEADSPEKMEAQIKRIYDARERIKATVEKLEPTLVLPEGKAAMKRVLEARTGFIDGQEKVIGLLRAKKADEAREFILTEMRKRQGAYAEATGALLEIQRKAMKETGEAASAESSRAIAAIVIALLISVALAAAITWLIIRDLVAQLGGEPVYAADNVKAIAAGDLSRRIETRPGDTTSMMVSLQTMQTGLAGLINEIKQMVEAAGRGDFSSKISMAGKQGFGREISEALNDLGETTNTGLNDVMRVAQALAEGDLSQKIEKNYPGVFGQTGSAVNATVEALKRIVSDIDGMVQGANRGDFSTRVDLAGKKGFALDLGKLLNQLSETTDSGLRDVMRVAQALAVGDLGKRIEKDYPGVFGETGRSINATVDALKRIVDDIDKMVQAANRGDFSSRVDLAGKQGFAHELSELLNQLSETTETGLNDVMRVAGTLAQGDLTHKIDKDYPGLFGQVGASMNSTVQNLTRLIIQIKEAVDSINTASSEIATGNQDLSSRTEEQASSLEETASSMEELTSTVRGNTQSATDANTQAKAAAVVAERGGETVRGSVTIMADIATSSKKIADIIGVIDSIAFQTNILALNAAVEAARAGEQGRGFAVVATEVRNLAHRSAEAAKEIKGLIGESVARVEAGNAQANQAGEQMTEIVAAIASVSALISDIAAASSEQAQGIEQVTQAVSQMDEVTQQNAALVEEAAAAAESLQEQAEQLARAVAAFKTDNDRPIGPAALMKTVARSPVAPKKLGHSIPAARPLPKAIAAPKSIGEVEGDEWAEF